MSRRTKRDDRLTFVQSFIAGGVAGVVSRTVTSPFDVVKILSQVGTKDTKNGFFNSFKNLYKNEGMKAFWKGNGLACIRLFPYNAVQFAVFTKLKVLMSDPQTGNLSPRNALIAGSLSGVAATICTYPMDMVKTRLTASHVKPKYAKYPGIQDAFRTILKEEGVTAFYKGIGISIIGVIPFAGGTFMAYEMLDVAWGKPREKMSPVENFVNGCLAAAFAQTFSFPFDTIRKKLQAQSESVPQHMRPDVDFKGTIDAFRQTVKQYGVLGLWKGTAANLAKVVPYAGVMFACFEACKRFFLWTNGYTESPFSEQPKPGVDQFASPKELKSKKNGKD